MREYLQLPKPDDIGWITATLVFLYVIAKYAPVWLRALRDTHSVATANLITGLQRQIDALQQQLRDKENTIQNLIAQEHDRKDEIDRLREELHRLKEGR